LLQSNGVRGLKTRRALNAQARDLAQHQSALSLSHEQGVQPLMYILINVLCIEILLSEVDYYMFLHNNLSCCLTLARVLPHEHESSNTYSILLCV
jgi:hypothetical protein